MCYIPAFSHQILKYLSSVLLIVCTLTIEFASAKVSISSKRIYLDNEQSTTDFVVTNRGLTQRDCKLDTTHYTFDEFGSMTEYTGKNLPSYAAENVMRFSPSSFLLESNNRQTVRFTLRRKKDTAPIEYRAYLVVNCKQTNRKNTLDESNRDDIAKITIEPNLVHNIPIIIRPKALDATVDFLNVTLDKNVLTFDISRDGTRSIYGAVTVTDRSNGETLTTSAPFSIYHETQVKRFVMDMSAEYQLENLQLTLNEDASYGGNIMHSWPAQMNSGE